MDDGGRGRAHVENTPELEAYYRELDAVSHTLGAYRQVLIDGLRPEFRDDCMGMRRSTDMFGNDNGFFIRIDDGTVSSTSASSD